VLPEPLCIIFAAQRLQRFLAAQHLVYARHLAWNKHALDKKAVRLPAIVTVGRLRHNAI
jgi:hypothetical protein